DRQACQADRKSSRLGRTLSARNRISRHEWLRSLAGALVRRFGRGRKPVRHFSAGFRWQPGKDEDRERRNRRNGQKSRWEVSCLQGIAALKVDGEFHGERTDSHTR